MKKPYYVKWDTGCSSNFATASNAMAAISKGLKRVDGNLQRGAARLFNAERKGWPRLLARVEPDIKEGMEAMP